MPAVYSRPDLAAARATWKRENKTVVFTNGCYDLLHPGHVRYFAAAARLGAPVLCNIASDDYLSGKHRPLLTQAERGELIDALRPIDYVHLSPTSTEDVLRALRPRYYVKGDDWRDRLPAEQIEICAAEGIEIVYLDTVTGSSTAILKRWAAA